jgi:hypothetical protein
MKSSTVDFVERIFDCDESVEFLTFDNLNKFRQSLLPNYPEAIIDDMLKDFYKECIKKDFGLYFITELLELERIEKEKDDKANAKRKKQMQLKKKMEKELESD